MFKAGNNKFKFVGKLQEIKATDKQKGTIQKMNSKNSDWEKTSLVFKAEIENQGELRLQIEGTNFPVRYYEKDENGKAVKDSKGQNVYKDFKAGDKALDWDKYMIFDRIRKVDNNKGKVQEFYHPLEFVEFIEKNLKSFLNKKLKAEGVIERQVYKGRLYEKYLIQSITTNPEEEDEGLVVTDIVAVDRSKITNHNELPTYTYVQLRAKDKTDFALLKDKTFKFNGDYFFDGILKDEFGTDTPVELVEDIFTQLKSTPYAKIEVNYKPVIKSNMSKKEENSADRLPTAHKRVYEQLLKKSKESADKFLKQVSSAVELAEGGFKIEYMIVDLGFSSDNVGKNFDYMTEDEFLETSMSLAEENQDKEKRKIRNFNKFLVKRETSNSKVIEDTNFNAEDNFDTDYVEDVEEEVKEDKPEKKEEVKETKKDETNTKEDFNMKAEKKEDIGDDLDTGTDEVNEEDPEDFPF